MLNRLPLPRIVAMCLGVALVGVVSASAQSADAGQKVYTAQKCSLCHSVAGVGNKKGALDGIGSKLSADDIRAWITDAPTMAAKAKADRKPPMKAYTLPKEDLDTLVGYLQGLKK
ncbi:MAG TPA: cytochrome c [Vicinamibacterales bacterium]|nr:cytochrome c [Vicinamibacterales bacterium]